LDLLNCRQVSQLWKNAAKKDFQEKLTFHVNMMEYLYHRDRDVKSFMTHAVKSFPMFRNFRVDLNKRFSSNSVLQGLVQLFGNHGKFLHKLQLNFPDTSYLDTWTLDDFRDIFLSSLDEIRDLQINMSCKVLIHEDIMFFPHHVKKVLPKLTTLNIGLHCNGCILSRHENTQVFSDFLRLIPNLKTLYWRSRDYKNDEQDGSKSLIPSLLLVNPIELENLFIYSKIADGLACSIANSDLNLKQLYLVDFRGFELHFFSTPTADRKKCEVTPKNATYTRGQVQLTGPTLKTHLESVLAVTTYMSCTNLLRVFASTLERKLNEG